MHNVENKLTMKFYKWFCKDKQVYFADRRKSRARCMGLWERLKGR